MVTVFAEIESIETENGAAPRAPAEMGRIEGPHAEHAEGAAPAGPRPRSGMVGSRGPGRTAVAVREGEAPAAREGEAREGEVSLLGPDDIVPIEYAAVPGTTTNMPGSHSYPDTAAPLTLGGARSTMRVKLLAPHSGSFELHVSTVPAGTLQVGRVKLSLSEA
jgi:hypothetical protein